jgi:catechol 2,3-dioxygenase-like lactoylglutathione lyase family enzyme
MEMKFNHVGLVVENIEKSAEFYVNVLKMEKITEVIYDPNQRVHLLFIEDQKINGLVYELIQPIDESSPSAQWLEKGNSLQHFCYEVKDINKGIDYLKQNGGVLFVRPIQAIAFNNRLIAFLLTKEKVIIELLEEAKLC